MFSNLVRTVKSVSITTAKVAVGGAGGLIGGTAGMVAGVAVGATLGTVAGCKAGAQMALGMVWPKDHDSHEAEELVKNTAADIRAEIRDIESQMRDLAGPAKPAKRGPGRPKKQTSYGPGWESIETATIRIDGRELDDQEVRDFLSGKGHLRPDPIF